MSGLFTRQLQRIARESFPTLGFCLVLMAAFVKLNLREGDDFSFRAALENTDWLTFATTFHENWSGRYAFSLLFPTLIQEQWIWLLRLILVGAVALFALSAVRFVECRGAKLDAMQKTLFWGAFFLLYHKTTGAAVLWLTGAFNYFLPFALFLHVAMRLCDISRSERVTLTDWLVCPVFILFAVSFEQLAVIVVMYLVYSRMTCKNCYTNRFLNVLIVVSLAGAAVLFSAPGNYARFAAEMKTWYPGFTGVHVSKKIFDMFQLYLESILIFNAKFTVFFSLVMTLVVWNGTLRLQDRIFSGCLPVLAALPVFFQCIGGGLQAHFPYGAKMAAEDVVGHLVFDPAILFSMAYATTVGLYFVFILSKCCQTLKEFLFILMLLVLGSASFGAMAFSPTMYASEYRTHFFTNMFFWLAFGIILSKVRNRKQLYVLFSGMLLAFLGFVPLVLEKFTKFFG